MPKEQKLTPHDEPKLSVYQTLLLNEFKKKPELMQLLKVIFDDYPKIVVAEITCLKGATRRRQEKGIEIGTLRMKMEAFIEEKIARIAGIDVDKFADLQKEEDAKMPLEKAMDLSATKMATEISEEQDTKILASIKEVSEAVEALPKG